MQSGCRARGVELREIRPEDLSFDVCHSHAPVRFRCANSSALDGAQILGDDHAVSCARERHSSTDLIRLSYPASIRTKVRQESPSNRKWVLAKDPFVVAIDSISDTSSMAARD